MLYDFFDSQVSLELEHDEDLLAELVEELFVLVRRCQGAFVGLHRDLEIVEDLFELLLDTGLELELRVEDFATEVTNRLLDPHGPEFLLALKITPRTLHL